VVEHGNVGRAAAALHIAQPVLSRQIRALEHELGADLFARDASRTRLVPTRLTAAGQALLEGANALLPAAEAARRRVRDAAEQVRRLTIGYTPGVPIAPAVAELSRRHADVTVEVLRMDWLHRVDTIRDGRADVGYLRLPADLTGLGIEPLFAEPYVVRMPTGHRLTTRTGVTAAELADEPMIATPADAATRRAATGAEPASTPAAPVARSIEELLEHVAAGRGLLVLPLSVAEYFSRPGLTHVVLSDVAPARVCLAWQGSRRDPLVREYVEIAGAIAGQR
jgi:DNA-binding transcriptional LysR family regulator